MSESDHFARVGDHLRLQYGKPLPETQRVSSDGYPAYGANGVKVFSREFFSDRPTIIVGRKGSAGEVTLTEERYWPLDVTYFLEFDRTRHDLRYLYHLLRWLDLPSLAKGVKPGLNRDEAYELRAPFPPLTEQQFVAARLDQAFERIELAISNTEKAIENAKALSAATISNLTSKAATALESHTVRTLIERGILEKISDGNHGEIHPTRDEYVDQGVPFIMASDLCDGLVDQTTCRFISEDRAQSLRVGFARDGDVLLSHKGTIGRVARLETTFPYVMLTPQVTYYRVRDQKALFPRYLYHALRGQKFQEQLQEIAGIGSTRAYIGITRQLDLRLALPPAEAQSQLSNLFDQVDVEALELERALTAKLTALTELKQSFLARAFSGELTREPRAA